MLVHVFFMACDFKGKCVAKELLDLCMMKWRDSMEFLLESHSTVEKSYRLVYGARNKRCNLPAAPLAGAFIKMVISDESYNDEMKVFQSINACWFIYAKFWHCSVMSLCRNFQCQKFLKSHNVPVSNAKMSSYQNVLVQECPNARKSISQNVCAKLSCQNPRCRNNPKPKKVALLMDTPFKHGSSSNRTRLKSLPSST